MFLGFPSWHPPCGGRRRLLPSAAAQAQNPLRLAMIGNTYHYGSEIQTIADRFLVGYGHEGDWHIPNVKVVSMYVESRARFSGGRWQTAWAGIVAAGARGSAATSHSRA